MFTPAAIAGLVAGGRPRRNAPLELSRQGQGRIASFIKLGKLGGLLGIARIRLLDAFVDGEAALGQEPAGVYQLITFIHGSLAGS
jgi:hypothetical protein